MALGTTGMDLINSLGQSYIEDHLSHIPEVAAEYTAIRMKREARQKTRFIAFAALIILGVGLGYMGYSAVFFPERSYDYRSPGVIPDGE